ncbi:MAG: hypothetical protein PVJ76_18740, partial [Gemmatimonadota bacterium]
MITAVARGRQRWSSLRVFLAVSPLLFLSLTVCRGQSEAGDPGLSLDLAISPTPPAVGPARLIITFS